MKKCVASLETVVAIHVGIDVVTVILIFADVVVAATLILIFADVAIAAALIVISIAEGFNCQWYGQIISGKYFEFREPVRLPFFRMQKRYIISAKSGIS